MIFISFATFKNVFTVQLAHFKNKTSLFNEKTKAFGWYKWPESSVLASLLRSELVSALLSLTCRRFHWVSFQIQQRNQKIRVNINRSKGGGKTIDRKDIPFYKRKCRLDWIVQHVLNVSPFLFIHSLEKKSSKLVPLSQGTNTLGTKYALLKY